MNDLQGDLLCDSGLGGLDLLLQGYDRALLRNLLASLRPAADHYRGSVHILDNLFLVKKHQTIVIANRTLITSNNDNLEIRLNSAAVSIFVVILVKLTNTVFVNSTNITTNIETAVLSRSGRTYDCPPQEACACY